MPQFDYLKNSSERIYYFGLGFIQVVLDKDIRYHFYSQDLPSFAENPHNHRYNFNSMIIKGTLIQEIYEISDGDSHLLYHESCNEEKEAPKDEKLIGIKKIFRTMLNKGSDYWVDHNIFHTVQPIGDTITEIIRSDYQKEFADIIRPANEGKICPFSKKIEEKQLWNIVEEMMKAKTL